MNNKPITIIRDEFIQNVVNLCNDSGLPFFVIEDVLSDLLKEIHGASIKQLEDDKKRYEAKTKAKVEE